MKIIHVVGARPNFMKATPVINALEPFEHIEQVLVHTGQHYDDKMSGIFFSQLALKKPDFNLEVGSGSHAVQTAKIMEKFETVCNKIGPDLLVVYGDVNSTVACSLVASKLGIKIAHVEAGLRSGDRSMPEEINRIVTDQLSDFLFTHSYQADENLKREGISEEKIFMVGNVMIDTLVCLLDKIHSPETVVIQDNYLFVTLHRPSNVDPPEKLKQIFEVIKDLSKHIQVIFSLHPRTQKNLQTYHISIPDCQKFTVIKPVGYLECLWLQKNARVILTDSGGIQEESTYLGVPCLTLRENTERPITLTNGTNLLLGSDPSCIKAEVKKILSRQSNYSEAPPMWDGFASQRIAQSINSLFF